MRPKLNTTALKSRPPLTHFSEHRGPSENTTKVAPHFNQNFSIQFAWINLFYFFSFESSWLSFDMEKRKFFLILKGKSHRLKYRFGEGSVFDLSHMRKRGASQYPGF